MIYEVLITDDCQLDIDTTLKEFANEKDMVFTCAHSAAEAIALVKARPDKFAVILTDVNMPKVRGDQLARELLLIHSKLNIVMLSGDTGQAAPINSWRAGAHDFIDKNSPASEKIAIVRNYCKKFDEFGRVFEFKQDESERTKTLAKVKFVGRSQAQVQVAEQILHIKDSDSTVLIRGPSGVGKELIAKAVHNNSTRKGRQLITLNCGAIAEGLIESELFGHEKGAFTNAINKKIGKFQLANFSTIFLDEIGDMPMSAQVKLLRVLQEGTIDPVGAKESIKVNVRVIAATNKNLEEAVKKGTFREDLYYRLNVIPFFIPALKDRKEDIQPLVDHFVRSHPTGSEKVFLHSTIKFFLDYNWPGNIRELENTVDRLLTLTRDKYIAPVHLDPVFFANHTSGVDLDCDWKSFQEQKKVREDEAERKYLTYHITKSKSVRDLALSVLKMPKSTLQARIEELGIEVRELLKMKGPEHAGLTES